MGLTYDGITYRSLEEQVRYDAEQVQLLKQADVTINENLQNVNESLQTVNTEINGKLTKPANPSAESAVTMLADGTVGTKLLSEIGGGGKFYLHNTSVPLTKTGYQFDSTYITFLCEKETLFTSPTDIPPNTLVCGGYVSIFSNNNYLYYAPTAEPFDYSGKSITFIEGTKFVSECTISQIINDTVTEL